MNCTTLGTSNESVLPNGRRTTSPDHVLQRGYVAEGVTTYMGDLFLFESGIVDLKGWCALMAKLLERHLNNPGRLNIVFESSYDTWLDGYRLGAGRKGIYVEAVLVPERHAHHGTH